MKRAIPAIILCAMLLSGCYDDYYEEPETTAVSRNSTGAGSAEETSTEDSTAAPIIPDDPVPPHPEDVPEPVPQENILEPSEESTTVSFTETTVTETTESAETEPAEPEQTAETAVSEPTADPPTVTESITENAAEPPTEPVQTDYEKALAVYEYIRENGCGTCVQYASQTYDLCQEVGLPCWYVWTDAGIYGHVANTVCVDGIWFIMDTQAGCFLTFNYGFTEVVDKEMQHIGDAQMLSDRSYAELFGS